MKCEQSRRGGRRGLGGAAPVEGSASAPLPHPRCNPTPRPGPAAAPSRPHPIAPPRPLNPAISAPSLLTLDPARRQTRILTPPPPPSRIVIRAVIEPLLAATRAELASARAAGVGDAQLASSPGPALHALRRAVNVRDSAGRTPLHLAAKRGHLACVRELARSCATNVFVSDHAGCTWCVLTMRARGLAGPTGV